MADAPEKIDINNLPEGAEKWPIKDESGNETGRYDYTYMGYVYNYKGERGVTVEKWKELSDFQKDPISAVVSQLMSQFGAGVAEWAPRVGLILLGAALIIIAVALIIAGSKTAKDVVSSLPVGKVLSK